MAAVLAAVFLHVTADWLPFEDEVLGLHGDTSITEPSLGRGAPLLPRCAQSQLSSSCSEVATPRQSNDAPRAPNADTKRLTALGWLASAVMAVAIAVMFLELLR